MALPSQLQTMTPPTALQLQLLAQDQLHSGLLPQGNPGAFDFDDWGETTNGYGSFQVHNLTNTQTVLAWNNHGSTNPDFGFGNGGGNPDWTFNSSLFMQSSSWKLSIYVR